MRRYALSLGLKSLKQHRRRNIAAGCAIGIGYIAMLFVLGYAARIDKYLSTATIYLQQSGHVAVFKKGGLRNRMIKPQQYSLSPGDVKAVNAHLEKQPGWEFTAPYLISTGLIGNGCKSFPFVGRGFVPGTEQRIMQHDTVRSIIPEFQSVLRGKALWETQGSNQVSLARGLSRRMGKSLKDEVGKAALLLSLEDCASPQATKLLAQDSSVQLLGRTFDGRNGALDADFTSEYTTGLAITEDTSLQAPLAFMQELVQTDKVSYLAVFLQDRMDAPRFARDLKAEMRKQKILVDAYAWNDKRLNPAYVQGQSAMAFTIFFVSTIVIGVALLSILNTLSIGLAESRREIGTLLAIGYNPVEVAWIFTVEAFATSVMALIVGAAGAYGICEFVGSLAIPLKAPGFSHATTFQFTPTLMNYILVSFVLCVLASLTTFLMARRYASRSILTLLDRGG